tara:strand:- start:966 stop:2162 length:1197 start_codon:yes stop_codon:yes gene_type:complete
MTSAIVRTNPTSGSATTSSVRDNFGASADEINRLLRATTDKAVATGIDVKSVSFGNIPTFALIDGIRILIEIEAGGTTTVANPSLIVNGGSSKLIRSFDGTSLITGDLVEGGYYELVYDSEEDLSPVGAGIWKVLSPTPVTNTLSLILQGVYPVGSILTTTRSDNPGDLNYFYAGTTFGTWVAYAEGRVIAGIKADFDLNLSTAVLSLNIGGVSRVAWTTTAAHGLTLGDLVEVSGVPYVTTDINGTYVVRNVTSTTSFEYDKIGATASYTESYTADSDSILALKTFNTVNEESGVEYNLDENYIVSGHSHQWLGENTDITPYAYMYAPNSGTGGLNNSTWNVTGDEVPISSGSNPNDSYTDTTIYNQTVPGAGDTTINDFTNNVQPTIATYIWTRTA